MMAEDDDNEVEQWVALNRTYVSWTGAATDSAV